MGRISEKGRGIGIVGSRELPESFRGQVLDIVLCLLKRGYRIHTGGAVGANMYALQSVISAGSYKRAVIFSAWSSIIGFLRKVQPLVEQYIQHSGKVSWGLVQPHSSRQMVVDGLLLRNKRLVCASAGIVAFLYGESRGTSGTVWQAVRRGIRVVVFLCGGGARLPVISGGIWQELRCGGVWAGGYIFRAC